MIDIKETQEITKRAMSSDGKKYDHVYLVDVVIKTVLGATTTIDKSFSSIARVEGSSESEDP